MLRLSNLYPNVSRTLFRNMSKNVLMIATDGSEDSELVITMDLLRRAGNNVTLAGLGQQDMITCVEKTKICVDCHLANVSNELYDAVVLPGGPGADKLGECEQVGEILKRHEKEGRIVAAICGAPLALKCHGIASGCKLTAYPEKKKQLVEAGYQFLDEPVVVCNNIVTSQGPGTAFQFGIKLVEILDGKEKAKETAEHILCQ